MADRHGPASRQSTRHPTGPMSPMNPRRATHCLTLHHGSDATASERGQPKLRTGKACRDEAEESSSPSAPVEEEPVLTLTTARPSGSLPHSLQPTWCAVYRHVHITELMVQQCWWVRHNQK